MTVIENRVRVHLSIINYQLNCLQGQCPIRPCLQAGRVTQLLGLR